jgi:signal transduction histidine kinase
MLAENSLRRRLVTACVLLAAVIGGVFAAAAYVIIEGVEYELIDQRLSRAADQLMDRDHRSIPAAPFTDLRVVAGENMPEHLQALKPGLHEVEVEGNVLKVYVVKNGARHYAVIDDVSDFERLEFIAFTALWIAFFCGVLLALAIARASASRIIAPLTVLARTVQQDNLAAHPELLNAADEIGVLARALEARSAQLANFLSRERFFTADVSHELRTPLTVMLGAAELLTARLEESPELHTMAERIRRTAAETSGRVSALLQLARAPGPIAAGPLPLRSLVQQEIERCRPLLDGKPVALSFEAPDEVWVRAAPDLPAIAVSNLLRNACHFTERGSVRVALGCDALVVEDTGPGVPQAVRRRLFEPFVRGRDDASAGSGLGLSIVKRVTEHLGWTIRLDDAPHGGSRFTLTFAPLQPV